MKQRFWWTTVVLLTTACGTTSTSHAEPNRPVNLNSDPDQIQVSPWTEVITKIQPHEITGKPAATLYVRNIPVLTFIESAEMTGDSNAETEMGSAGSGLKATGLKGLSRLGSKAIALSPIQAANPRDPVSRAEAIAASLNQLRESNATPEITLEWNGDLDEEGYPIRDEYLIKVNGMDLVAIDEQTRLPDTTNDLAQDAIQATNRLRRLIASAPAIAEIANRPQPRPAPEPPTLQAVTPEYLQYQINGMASWYGPGFHGRMSASGEIFDENALTAAHLYLPFGTQVRVTNLDNGNSVVVRINDRGPYTGGRIIDVSAAAAQNLGMINSGVAPVRLEILGTSATSSAE